MMEPNGAVPRDYAGVIPAATDVEAAPPPPPPPADKGGPVGAVASKAVGAVVAPVGAVASKVGGVALDGAAQPLTPVIVRALIWLFSLISWAVTASIRRTDALNFQLACGLCVWIFNSIWFPVELCTFLEVALPFGIVGHPAVAKLEVFTDALLSYLLFGAACAVASQGTYVDASGRWASNVIASNVFLWFTWLLEFVPMLIFLIPAFYVAAEAGNKTVLRSALGTKSV